MAETKLLGKSDEEEIWLTIRSVLTFARVVVLFGTIVVSELFEEYYFLDLTIAIWSLIIGIPLFFVISVLILWGNKSFIPVDPKEQMTKIRRQILQPT